MQQGALPKHAHYERCCRVRSFSSGEHIRQLNTPYKITPDEVRDEAAQGIADGSHVISRQSIRVSGEPAMGEDVPDAGCVGEDGQIHALLKLFQEDDLGSALRMFSEEFPQPVLRILFPAELRKIPDVVAWMMGQKGLVGWCGIASQV